MRKAFPFVQSLSKSAGLEGLRVGFFQLAEVDVVITSEFFTVLHVFLPESAGIWSMLVDSGNSAEWNFSSTAC